MIKLYNGDCLAILSNSDFIETLNDRKIIFVTDPPFNVGYHYNECNDNLEESEYLDMLKKIFLTDSVDVLGYVVIHYPEMLHKLSIHLQESPNRVVSWVYNSNTPRQHRDVAFYRITPDFTKIRQQYKNLHDKRIKQRLINGDLGGKLYDWWEINQVKNISKSKEKLVHPCIMPIDVMYNIVGILPKDVTIVDPFMGSGTTGIACKMLGVDFVGIELNREYFDEAQNRINSTDAQLNTMNLW